MIIIVILLLIIIWTIKKIFFTTNIVYDLMCKANVLAETESSDGISSFLSTNKNIIKNKDITENNNTNFMLSVWIFIEQWESTVNEKNILYMSHNVNAITHTELQNNFSGISIKTQPSTDQDTTTGNPYKNVALSLDKYENNLFIDIETYSNENNKFIYTRYMIKNIPLQKWNFITLSVDARTLDVYLDGKLRNSFILHGVYRSVNGTNVKNIYLGNMNELNRGFQGFITRVRYGPEASNPQQTYNMYREGINGSLANSVFNKYGLKVSFLEYNKVKGEFSI